MGSLSSKTCKSLNMHMGHNEYQVARYNLGKRIDYLKMSNIPLWDKFKVRALLAMKM